MSGREADATPAADAEVPEQESLAPEAEAQAEDEATALRREVEALREKNLRLMAESQNLQKRAQREKEEKLRYAEAEFARDLLVVLDDLERTREAAAGDDERSAVADGIRIVQEHFIKILQQRGVEPIEAVGKPFNPSFHEALMQQPSTEHPPGTVIDEWARGYKMHERVLRPSRVIVSGGAPQDGAQNDAAPQRDDEVK